MNVQINISNISDSGYYKITSSSGIKFPQEIFTNIQYALGYINNEHDFMGSEIINVVSLTLQEALSFVIESLSKLNKVDANDPEKYSIMNGLIKSIYSINNMINDRQYKFDNKFESTIYLENIHKESYVIQVDDLVVIFEDDSSVFDSNYETLEYIIREKMWEQFKDIKAIPVNGSSIKSKFVVM